MLKAVFFDAAGTLFEAREPVGRSYARIARAHGLDAPEAAVIAGFRRAFAAAPVIAFGPGHPADELRRLERGWWRAVVEDSFAGLGEFADFGRFFDALFAYFAAPANWQADPDAIATLTGLRQSGLKLGVISNFDYRLYRLLEGLGFSGLFESVTISSEAGYAKPRREIFDAALASHGIAAADAMHVGDSLHHDFEPARALGWFAVLIDPALPSSVLGSAREARINSLAYLNTVTQRLKVA
ncbi:MAG TPA: HAD-IA family hydrolase [Candidatus Binataceae bacterium]|nr:HAD-IA family hydrolase [Candidatus Binataceae bacterium]